MYTCVCVCPRDKTEGKRVISSLNPSRTELGGFAAFKADFPLFVGRIGSSLGTPLLSLLPKVQIRTISSEFCNGPISSAKSKTRGTLAI